MFFSYIKKKFLLLIILFGIPVYIIPQQQVTLKLNADGPGNTYELIDSVFGSGASSEMPDYFPDCNEVHIRHVREDWDSTLNKYVFLFDIYADSLIDYDRCSNTDRQRVEIKTVASGIRGYEGDVQIMKWKFKMDKNFQPSPNFCHLHQIKHTGGPDDSMPLITITPRNYDDPNQPEWLQLIFTPSTGLSGGGTLDQVELEPLKGIWLDVTEQAYYSDEGKYELTIKKLDGTPVMHYINYDLDMSRGKDGYHRGKWGIYRSLNSKEYLRDETVKFSDFEVTSALNYSTPAAPGDLSSNAVSDKEISLTWTDNSDNETNFLIQYSTDDTNWTTAGTVDTNTVNFSCKGLMPATKYYFRVRAENWNKFSEFSNITETETQDKKKDEFNLALNKPVTFSDQQVEEGNENPAVNAVDGDTDTRWSASGFPQWLEVDLGSDLIFNKTEIVCYSDRAYQFIIETKAESDSDYRTIVDRTFNTDQGSVDNPLTDVFDSVKARYVKINVSGCYDYSGTWVSIAEFRIMNTSKVTSIVNNNMLPVNYELQNYPNPFNPATVISFSIPKAGNVLLKVYNALGQEIATLVNEYKDAANYKVSFNASNLSSGVYFYRLEAGSFVSVKKMLLLR